MWLAEKSSQCCFWLGVKMPEPLQRGQTLPSAATMADLMKLERFGMCCMASLRSSSTLKVIMSCFFFMGSAPGFRMVLRNNNIITTYYLHVKTRKRTQALGSFIWKTKAFGSGTNQSMPRWDPRSALWGKKWKILICYMENCFNEKPLFFRWCEALSAVLVFFHWQLIVNFS